MVRELCGQELGQRNVTSLVRLRGPNRDLARMLGRCLDHVERSTHEVDPLTAQRGGLAPTQAGVREDTHQQRVITSRVGERVDLIVVEEDHVRLSDARELHAKTVRTKERFVAFVREATFVPRDDLDMLFVLADVVHGRYTDAWLVPSPVFAGLAKVRNNGTRRFSASLKPASQDQWVPYRRSPTELPLAVLARLTELAEA